MLGKYINGTKKKVVATSLALITTFSAVAISPNYHSYDSNFLQVDAIETQNSYDELESLINDLNDELRDLWDELTNLKEDELQDLEDELQRLEKKESEVYGYVKRFYDSAIESLKIKVNEVYKNGNYTDSERIDEIYSAIEKVPGAMGLGRHGDPGSKIFRTITEPFSDTSKDLLYKIFDSSESLKESKELIENLIDNLCEDSEKIRSLTAESVDPQNSKSEIKNKIAEIEQQIDKIKQDIVEIKQQINDKSKSLAEVLAKEYFEAETRANSIENKYDLASTNLSNIEDEYDKVISPAKTKWEKALNRYEHAIQRCKEINPSPNNDEFEKALGNLVEANNEVNQATNEYIAAKVAADDKYKADLTVAESEYLKLDEIMCEYDTIFREIENCLYNGLISTQGLKSALTALGYNKDELYETGLFNN